MKYMAKKGKMVVKKWVLGSKSGFWGCKNYGLGANLERQNGAKYRWFS